MMSRLVRFAERVARFCNEGPNKGKPGPCPDANSKRQQRLSRRGERMKKLAAEADGAKAAKPEGGSPDVRKDLSELSSGTIATLTGRREYANIDAVRVAMNAWLDKNPGKKWDSWQSAWTDFARENPSLPKPVAEQPPKAMPTPKVEPVAEQPKPAPAKPEPAGHYEGASPQLQVQHYGRSLKTTPVEFAWEGKQLKGDQIGPFAVVKVPGGHRVHHVQSGLAAGRAVANKDEAKAFAAALGSRGNWNFQDVAQADKVTIDGAAEINRAFARGEIAQHIPEADRRAATDKALAKERVRMARENLKAKPGEIFTRDVAGVMRVAKKMDANSLGSLVSRVAPGLQRVALEDGWATDGRFMVQMTPKDKDIVSKRLQGGLNDPTQVAGGVDQRSIRKPDLSFILKPNDTSGFHPAQIVGGRVQPAKIRMKGRKKIVENPGGPTIMVRDDAGRESVLNANYHQAVMQRFPRAVPHIRVDKRGGHSGGVYYKQDGETVGVVMPLSAPKGGFKKDFSERLRKFAERFTK